MSAAPTPTNNRSGAEARDYFAAERTLLAWIRTGLAMMGFGFVVARFGLFLRELAASGLRAEHEHIGLSLWFGTGLVVLGVVVTFCSAIAHRRTVDRLQRGDPLIYPKISLGIIVAWTLALLGLAMAIYLAVGLNQ